MSKSCPDDPLANRDSPNFLDSLSNFKDKFISDAEEFFSPTDNGPSAPQSKRRLISPSSSFDFTFPWTPRPASAAEQTSVSDRPSAGSSSDEDQRRSSSANSFAQSSSTTSTGARLSRSNTLPATSSLKREGSFSKVANGQLTGGTLLQYSACNLTIQKIKPGDLPSLPEIIEDMQQLEGANPEQVALIIDKLETLQLTISALDKRLATIDRGLDKLMLGEKKYNI